MTMPGAGDLEAIFQLPAQDTTTEDSRGEKPVPSGKAKGDNASETKGKKASRVNLTKRAITIARVTKLSETTLKSKMPARPA